MERSWTTSRGGAMRRTGRSEIGDVTVRSLSGGPCVSLLHRGPYELLSRSYGKILDYLEGRGYASNGPIREIYLKGPGMILKGNPKKYLTEIQIPIEKR